MLATRDDVEARVRQAGLELPEAALVISMDRLPHLFKETAVVLGGEMVESMLDGALWQGIVERLTVHYGHQQRHEEWSLGVRQFSTARLGQLSTRSALRNFNLRVGSRSFL